MVSNKALTDADVRIVNGLLMGVHGSGRKYIPIDLIIPATDVTVVSSGFSVIGGSTVQEVLESVDYNLDLLISGSELLYDNEEYLRWKTDDGLGEVSVITMNSDDNVQINSAPGKVVWMPGDVVISNLTVTGMSTYLYTEQLLIEDNILTLNSNASGVPTYNAGIEINRGSSPTANFLWDEGNDYFKVGISGSEYQILTVNNNPLDLDFIPNDEYLKWYDSTSTSGIGVIKLDSSHSVVLNTEGSVAGTNVISTSNIEFQSRGITTAKIGLGNGDNYGAFEFDRQRNWIGVNTLDGSDNGELVVSAAGGVSTIFRSAFIKLTGRDGSNSGKLDMFSGQGGNLEIGTISSGDDIVLWSQGVKAWHVIARDLIPETSGTISIGSTSNPVNKLYVSTIVGGSPINFETDGSLKWQIDDAGSLIAQSGSNIVFRDDFTIHADSISGADTKALILAGGGEAVFHRGGYLKLFGSEYGNEDGEFASDRIFAYANSFIIKHTNTTKRFEFAPGTTPSLYISNTSNQGSLIRNNNNGWMQLSAGSNFTNNGQIVLYHGDYSGGGGGFRGNVVLRTGLNTDSKIRFMTSDTDKWHIVRDGHLTPATSGINLGSIDNPVDTLVVTTISGGSPINFETDGSLKWQMDDAGALIAQSGSEFIYLDDFTIRANTSTPNNTKKLTLLGGAEDIWSKGGSIKIHGENHANAREIHLEGKYIKGYQDNSVKWQFTNLSGDRPTLSFYNPSNSSSHIYNNSSGWIELAGSNTDINTGAIRCYHGDYSGGANEYRGNVVIKTGWTSAYAKIRLQTVNIDRWFIEGNGHFEPVLDAIYNIGAPGKSINNLYTTSGTVTSDLTVVSGHVIASSVPTASDHLTNKLYVDSLVSSSNLSVEDNNIEVLASATSLDFGLGLAATSGAGNEAEITVVEEEFENVVFTSGTQNVAGVKTFSDEVHVKTHTAYTNSENVKFTKGYQTAVAGPTTVETIPININSSMHFTVKLQAHMTSAGSKSYWVTLDGGAVRYGGTAGLIGTVSKVSGSNGSPAWDANIIASGNNIVLQLTGAVGETVTWTATIEYQEAGGIV